MGLSVQPPSGDPTWRGRLEAGDILYVPRGWWHSVIACDEPCLHLTVGLHNPRYCDIGVFLGEELRMHDHMRRDVHRSVVGDRIEEELLEVQHTLVALASDPGLTARFMHWLRATRMEKPVFDLPNAVQSAVATATETVEVLLPKPFAIKALDGTEAIALCVGESAIVLHVSAAPLLTALSESTSESVESFTSRFAESHGHEAVRGLLECLESNGVIRVRRESAAMAARD